MPPRIPAGPFSSIKATQWASSQPLPIRFLKLCNNFTTSGGTRHTSSLLVSLRSFTTFIGPTNLLFITPIIMSYTKPSKTPHASPVHLVPQPAAPMASSGILSFISSLASPGPQSPPVESGLNEPTQQRRGQFDSVAQVPLPKKQH